MLNTTNRPEIRPELCTECGGVDPETGGASPVAIYDCECEQPECTHRLYSQQKTAIAAIENLPLELLYTMHEIANNYSKIWAIKLFRESVGASLFQAKAVLEHTTALRVPVEMKIDNVPGVVGATMEVQVVTLREVADASAKRITGEVMEQLGVNA